MPKYPKYYVRPDGLHESIIHINGKRRAFRGHSDKEVFDKIRDFQKKAEARGPQLVTFAEAAELWWAEIMPTLEANTLKGYRPALRRAKDAFGDRPISKITAKEVEEYIRDFSGGRARKTVSTQLQVIRQICQKAQVAGVIAYNPAAAVSPPKNLPQMHRSAPTPQEIQLIKDSLSAPFGLFAYLIYYTGCRRGEALALKGSDIDRKKNVIHITKSVYHLGNNPHLKQPKSAAGNRVVPLLAPLAKALPARLPKSAYLFAEPDGSLLSNDHFTALYNEYRKSSGVTVTPHQIRHGYATALLESDVDPKTAQTLLGHAQLSTTMDIYTHVRDDRIRQAAEKMEKGF